MNNSLYIAATGMQAQQLTLDTISNNLVNINTPGFKRSRVNFNELMHVNPVQSSADGSYASAITGIGISADNITRDFAQGQISQTTSPFDVAINGNGFFEVPIKFFALFKVNNKNLAVIRKQKENLQDQSAVNSPINLKSEDSPVVP